MLARYSAPIGATTLLTAILGAFPACATTIGRSFLDVPRPGLPRAVTTLEFPAADRPGSVVPVTPPGPPDPQIRSDGRRGPWIADTDLMLVDRIAPAFPFRTIYRGIEGAVVVEFTVTRRGIVEKIEIVESPHKAFESVTRDAVAQWVYRPRIVDGAPIDTHGVRQRIVFRLEN